MPLMARTEAGLPDIRNVVRDATEKGRYTVVWELVPRMGNFLSMRGYRHEALGWLKKAGLIACSLHRPLGQAADASLEPTIGRRAPGGRHAPRSGTACGYWPSACVMAASTCRTCCPTDGSSRACKAPPPCKMIWVCYRYIICSTSLLYVQ